MDNYLVNCYFNNLCKDYCYIKKIQKKLNGTEEEEKFWRNREIDICAAIYGIITELAESGIKIFVTTKEELIVLSEFLKDNNMKKFEIIYEREHIIKGRIYRMFMKAYIYRDKEKMKEVYETLTR